MSGTEWITLPLLLVGAFFFRSGTVGMLRFPDVHTRLHALTKADNLGLGLVVVGLVRQAESWAAAAKLLVVWLLALQASAVACYLIAQWAARGMATRTADHPDA